MLLATIIMSKKIVFTAGGTGGHIFPAIHLMNHFSERGYEVLLVTDHRGKKFISNISKFRSHELTTDTPTNKNIFKKIFSIFSILISILKSIKIIKKEKPDLVFGLGGYVSFPISLASKIFRLPLVIYESNIIMGRTNKFLSPLSSKIFLAREMSIIDLRKDKFSDKYKNKISIVGTVINKKITNYTPKKITNAKKDFSILVLGGSQGAEVFGKIIPKVIRMLKEKKFEIEVMQQCIKNQKDEIKKFYEQNNIKNYVFDFDEDILNLILSSNLAITRCGATATAELAQTRTPFIAVPLPSSIDNHQLYNAKYYESHSCCWILEQKETVSSHRSFNEENLYGLILDIIQKKNKLGTMSEQKFMEQISNKNVYQNIENEINRII